MIPDDDLLEWVDPETGDLVRGRGKKFHDFVLAMNRARQARALAALADPVIARLDPLGAALPAPIIAWKPNKTTPPASDYIALHLARRTDPTSPDFRPNYAFTQLGLLMEFTGWSEHEARSVLRMPRPNQEDRIAAGKKPQEQMSGFATRFDGAVERAMLHLNDTRKTRWGPLPQLVKTAWLAYGPFSSTPIGSPVHDSEASLGEPEAEPA